MKTPGIRIVSIKDNLSKFRKHLADCLILTSDDKLYLQKHADNSKNMPGAIHLFGGHVEPGEMPLAGMIREIYEETGGLVQTKEAIFLGMVTEKETSYRDIVHIWFWHDQKNTITGCYEREPVLFSSTNDVLAHPLLMPYSAWAIQQALKAGLLR